MGLAFRFASHSHRDDGVGQVPPPSLGGCRGILEGGTAMKLPVLYVGPECPACETAKKFLELRGIAYEERSVEDPGVMEELLAITGKTTVPVLDLPTGELLIGWEPRRWARALDPEGVIVE